MQLYAEIILWNPHVPAPQHMTYWQKSRLSCILKEDDKRISRALREVRFFVGSALGAAKGGSEWKVWRSELRSKLTRQIGSS